MTILNIIWQDRKTFQWIREKTKVKDILETYTELKWNWAEHITKNRQLLDGPDYIANFKRTHEEPGLPKDRW